MTALIEMLIFWTSPKVPRYSGGRLRSPEDVPVPCVLQVSLGERSMMQTGLDSQHVLCKQTLGDVQAWRPLTVRHGLSPTRTLHLKVSGSPEHRECFLYLLSGRQRLPWWISRPRICDYKAPTMKSTKCQNLCAL